MASSAKALIAKAQSLIDSASPDQKRRILRLINADIVEAAALSPIWRPDSRNKPQVEAYYSEADEVLYGGSAGSGKTDLLLGLALTQHIYSVIFRRIYKELKGIERRMEELLGSRDGYNSHTKTWRIGERVVDFGGMERLGDERHHRGIPHDLVAFDEVAEFLEQMYVFMHGWNRSSDPKQRCRIVAAGNPPMTPEGFWVIRRWRPWLDDTHPNPAKSGELRWFATIRGKEKEFKDGHSFIMDGEAVTPRSRTFIKATVEDNPYYGQDYIATLQAYPEPLRSMLLKGVFGFGQEDDEWQVIPTDWILQAQSRWTEDGHLGRPQDALGVDPARGGQDEAVLSPRHGNWFAKQIIVEGKKVPRGRHMAALIADNLAPGANANVDVVGIGSSPSDYVEDWDLDVTMLNGAERDPDARDRTGRLGFKNNRAKWHWRLREALDPILGDNLAIPPDPQIRADLAAARWSLTPQGILIEDKESIKKRLGRSPDRGEGIIYANVDERPPSIILSSPESMTRPTGWNV